jgi:hypothetical protein
VWFAPFAPEERWLVLGTAAEPEARGPATASATRTLSYATAMPQARRRVAGALAAVRRAQAAGLAAQPGGPGPAAAYPELAEVGRWLEEFHPRSLVELDYGGLVHLLNDAALRADQSVAEVSAAIRALDDGEQELAAAMYQRLRTRWQALEALELAN